MKRIIIDGHNLIPKIPGIHLEDLDDESKLIQVVREYCRLARKQAELFFDGSPNPRNSDRTGGLVHIHFVKKGLTADDAIIAFLQKSGNEARHFLVISSDHRIQGEARRSGAEVASSDSFAQEVRSILSSPRAAQEMKEKTLSEGEVDEWMDIFTNKTDRS
ncbi:MAG: NYN domain-containing protein [Chloroflexi bacterium]|nr:NYN domain-containing protein [Chloroflexota bacterium]